MRFFLALLFAVCLFGADKQQSEIDYINKTELLIKHNKQLLKEIDEARQDLEAFKAAFSALQKEKETANAKKQEELEQLLKTIQDEKNANQELLEKIEQELLKLNEIKSSKVVESFAKMKEAPAAQILDSMDINDAANILRFLEPKKMGQILSKMPPQKAGQLSLIIADMIENKNQTQQKTNPPSKESSSPQNTTLTKDNTASQDATEEQKQHLKDIAKQMTN